MRVSRSWACGFALLATAAASGCSGEVTLPDVGRDVPQLTTGLSCAPQPLLARFTQRRQLGALKAVVGTVGAPNGTELTAQGRVVGTRFPFSVSSSLLGGGREIRSLVARGGGSLSKGLQTTPGVAGLVPGAQLVVVGSTVRTPDPSILRIVVAFVYDSAQDTFFLDDSCTTPAPPFDGPVSTRMVSLFRGTSLVRLPVQGTDVSLSALQQAVDGLRTAPQSPPTDGLRG